MIAKLVRAANPSPLERHMLYLTTVRAGKCLRWRWKWFPRLTSRTRPLLCSMALSFVQVPHDLWLQLWKWNDDVLKVLKVAGAEACQKPQISREARAASNGLVFLVVTLRWAQVSLQTITLRAFGGCCGVQLVVWLLMDLVSSGFFLFVLFSFGVCFFTMIDREALTQIQEALEQTTAQST